MSRRCHRPGRASTLSCILCTLLLMPLILACGIIDLGDDSQREPKPGEITVLGGLDLWNIDWGGGG